MVVALPVGDCLFCRHGRILVIRRYCPCQLGPKFCHSALLPASKLAKHPLFFGVIFVQFGRSPVYRSLTESSVLGCRSPFSSDSLWFICSDLIIVHFVQFNIRQLTKLPDLRLITGCWLGPLSSTYIVTAKVVQATKKLPKGQFFWVSQRSIRFLLDRAASASRKLHKVNWRRIYGVQSF